MQGYVVDKQGNPVTFMLKDPISGQVSTAIMLSRGGAVSLISATPEQLQPQAQQVQPTPPTQRIGVPQDPQQAAAPLPEQGIVVQDQAQPRPVGVPAVLPSGNAAPTAQGATVQGNGGGEPQQGAEPGDPAADVQPTGEQRPEALQQGAAAAL